MPAREPLQALDPEHYRPCAGRRRRPGCRRRHDRRDCRPASRAVSFCQSDCVLAGLDVAIEAFRQLDPSVEARLTKRDGDRLRPEEIAETSVGAGPSDRRTNWAQFSAAARARHAGLEFVKAPAPHRGSDTRDHADAEGTGKHAYAGALQIIASPFDAFLIKDNHVACRWVAPLSPQAADTPDLRVEMRSSLDQVDEALRPAPISSWPTTCRRGQV